MKNFIIDNTNNRIEFLDARFYKTEHGFVPSVTTILEAYPKDAAYFKWLKDVGSDADSIRDEAGRRGSIVHQLTEEYDSGVNCTFINESGYPKYKMNEWSMFERYVDFMQTYKPEIELMETNMISAELGFAGTLDRVIKLNGKSTMIDIKTSNSIYASYWLQLSAYNELLKSSGVNVELFGVLWLNAKTRTTGKNGAIQGIGWQLITMSAEELKKQWELFQVTHKLWLALNEDIKPRQTSYKLNYQK